VPEGKQEVPVHLKAGDVLFFNGNLIHGSYPNTSGERFRRSFICHYLPSSSEAIHTWFKPVVDFDGNEKNLNDAAEGGPCGTPTGPARSAF
jgi:hypothetical protein